MSSPNISIIIPVLNEGEGLPILLARLALLGANPTMVEIIVCDGGSTDDTVAQAYAQGVRVVNSPKGRARQLNAGAAVASGEILYFLHADTIPPNNFLDLIQQSYYRGHLAGCFRLRFDWNHWFLKFNAWFTRFNLNSIRFGDQSLYVQKRLFDIVGGFDESLILMEDQEIIYRITTFTSFQVIPEYVTTSARKYRENGPYRMQFVFIYLYICYYLGYSQESLVRLYNRLIRT
ncbi:TIGR04283 family arsenosugar biosynthesis glycosyltransferase [Dyadobacter tibetensis]|uniref:TIGR04283 family arsenosugar biosynthesis glycosyltransferase n=1 Tax=Dyadobacter tibetensis TaxID=1211851 RepID=UPI00047286D8|nr:TIGR04283 family arsenosugar biosynthesis glycosyltransferase [Dyadobacter tibetensis]